MIEHTCINAVNIMVPGASCKACADGFAKDPVTFAQQMRERSETATLGEADVKPLLDYQKFRVTRGIVEWMRKTYPQNEHAREWAAEIERVFLRDERGPETRQVRPTAECKCDDYLGEIEILRGHLRDAYASGWRSGPTATPVCKAADDFICEWLDCPAHPVEEAQRTWLALPMFPNDDQEINCIFCRNERPCEYALLVKRDGERALVGIHEKCVGPLRRKNEGRRERATATDKERRIVDAAIRWRERERVGLTTASAREELASACDAMTEGT